MTVEFLIVAVKQHKLTNITFKCKRKEIKGHFSLIKSGGHDTVRTERATKSNLIQS